MSKQSGSLRAWIAAGVVLAAGAAQADWRSFVQTYEHMTVAAGSTELEYYVSPVVPSYRDRGTGAWDLQVELEYGLTDMADMALYQKFTQAYSPAGSEFAYEGFKIRGRHQLAKRGVLPADPLLYVEYIRSSDFAEADELEGKLILARKLGPVLLVFNHVTEQELTSGTETENGFAAGAAVDVAAGKSLGVEIKGEYEGEGVKVGPTFSTLLQGGKWFAIGAMFAVTADSPDFSGRLIVGVPL